MSAEAHAPELRVEIARHADGSAVLRCVRRDGSVTWQRQGGKQGAFFARHDLTHYAVETVLGCRRAFFGLVAEGWGIEETDGKHAPGPLPAEAIAVEHLVGLLDVERATGAAWSAAELAEQLALAGADGLPLPLTDELLDRVRARRGELFARWAAVAPGDALALTFDRGAP